MVIDIFVQSLTIKKPSYSPDIVLVVAKNGYSVKDSFFNEGIRRISKSVVSK